MRVDDLRYFAAIARDGSIAASAQRLGVSQPTLSKSVARLERALKVALFERVARGMRPTPFGRAFLSRIEVVERQLEDALDEVRDLRTGQSGTVRVGLGQGVPDAFVVDAVTAWRTTTRASLEIVGGVTDSLLRALAAGDIDMAVIGLPRAPGGGVTWRGLFDDPVVVCAPLGHPLARARGVGWDALASAEWVVQAPGTSTMKQFERAFRAAGQTPPVARIASRASNRERALALATGALILMPRSVIARPDAAAAFAEVDVRPAWASVRRVGIARRRGAYQTSAARRLVECLAQASADRVAPARL